MPNEPAPSEPTPLDISLSPDENESSKTDVSSVEGSFMDADENFSVDVKEESPMDISPTSKDISPTPKSPIDVDSVGIDANEGSPTEVDSANDTSHSFMDTVVSSAKGVASDVGSAFSSSDPASLSPEENDFVTDNGLVDNNIASLQNIINSQNQKINELNEDIKQLLKERIATLESVGSSGGTGRRRRKTRKANRS